MHLVIIRDSFSADAALGTLTIGSKTLQVIAPPWIPDPLSPAGKPDVSCIPAGDYRLVRHDTPKHPKTFAFVNQALGVYHEPADIPPGCVGRTACLLHPANTASELEGCTALGCARTVINGVPFVTDSRDAFAQFQMLVPWMDGHTISIIDAPSATSGDVK